MSSRLDRVQDWKALAGQCGYSVERMAQEKGMSRQQLRRYFQKRLGGNPKDWLDLKRLEEAARRLAKGEPVKLVAAELKFKHASDLTRFFRRMTGQSPHTFQENVPEC